MRCQTAAELRADLKRLKRSIDSSRTSVVTETEEAQQSSSAAVVAAFRSSPGAAKEDLPPRSIFALGLLLAAGLGLFAGKKFFASAPAEPPLLPSAHLPPRQHPLRPLRP